ncbi:MAG: TonB-dependent receptor [Myxococcota bacterium]|nr:TonB-dependent receptor [Myxococcota bacterium]
MQRNKAWRLIAAILCVAATTGQTSLATAQQAPVTDTTCEDGAKQTLDGVILDAEGYPLPDVRVVIAGEETTSDGEGRVHLEVCGAPPFTAQISSDYFEPLTLDIDTLEEDGTLKMTVDLARAANGGEAAQVETRAEIKGQRTTTSSRVDSVDLEAVPMRTAEDALRIVPGVVLVQHGSEGKGHQFFLRGFDAIHGADLEVTLEGIPINEWSNIHAQGYLDLGFIIPELISEVEVIKGPFLPTQGLFAMAGSARYALGVAPDARGARVSYELGSTGRMRGLFTLSPREGNGRDFLAMELMADEGFGDQRAAQRASLMARRQLFASQNRSLTLMTGGYIGRFELPGLLRMEDVEREQIGYYSSYSNLGQGTSARGLIAANYQQTSGAHVIAARASLGARHLDLLENFTGYIEDPVAGDWRAQTQTTTSLDLAISDTLALREDRRIELELGAGMRGDWLTQREERVDPETEEIRALRRDLEATQAGANTNASLRLRPTDRHAIELGGRLQGVAIRANDQDANEQGGGVLAAPLPRVLTAYKPTSWLELIAAYGRGVRPPEARTFSGYEPSREGIGDEVASTGAPALTIADSVEMGATITANKAIELRGALFGTRIERESIFDHVSGLSLELNSTRRLGVESALAIYPNHWAEVHANMTFVDARFVESGNLVPLAPRFITGLRALGNHPSGISAGGNLLVIAARPLPHGATGSTYAALGATLGYKWRGMRAGLEVENVLNRRLREGEYHFASDWDNTDSASNTLPVIHYSPGAPINARLSLSATF